MPPERASSSRNDNVAAIVRSPIPLVARYNGRSIAIPRRVDYQHAITSVKDIFKPLVSVENDKIRLVTKFPSFGDEKIEVSSETWGEFVATLREVWIEVQEQREEQLPMFVPQTTTAIALPTTKKITVTVKIPSENMGTKDGIKFTCSPSTKVGKIVDAAARQANVCAMDFRWISPDCKRLDKDMTLEESGFEDGESIHAFRVQVGGKPVNVQLSLRPTWSFSALYPPTPIVSTKAHGYQGDGQTVSWTVAAMPDGTLIDKATNLEVSYLFWEAHTESPKLLTPSNSRPTSPSLRPEFDPVRACDWLTPESSVVLPINKTTSYLDVALKALTLHTEARTSFITYWLPSLLKHSHVALRFLPQDVYEGAAPLSIEPKPDVITRVFMIFRGVSEADEKWSEARARASQNVQEVWKDIVGVDDERALNTSLFRVLEWGGMEVVHGV